MDYGMISKIEKAKRYAEQRDRIQFLSFEVTFDGDNSPHTVYYATADGSAIAAFPVARRMQPYDGFRASPCWDASRVRERGFLDLCDNLIPSRERLSLAALLFGRAVEIWRLPV